MRTPVQLDGATALFASSYVPWLLQALRSAKDKVWISVFIIDARIQHDLYGATRVLLGELAQARKRDVDVRLLVARALGTPQIYTSNLTTIWIARHMGLEAKVFAAEKDAGTHSKYVLIDSNIAVVGSHNWSSKAFYHDIETSLAIESPALASQLSDDFTRHWNEAKDPIATSTLLARLDLDIDLRDPECQLDPEYRPAAFARLKEQHALQLRKTRRFTAPGRARLLLDREYLQSVADLIDGALESVDVVMFLFAEPPGSARNPLLESLLHAHARGVKVRVVLDKDAPGDPYLSRLINLRSYHELRNAGISVSFDDRRILLHAKLVMIDGTAIVIGSHNWTKGSFHRYDDTSVLVESPSLTTAYAKFVDAVWAYSTRHPTNSTPVA